MAKEITFPLTRRNTWTVHSGYPSFNTILTSSTKDKRLMWEFTANHPGMSDPTQLPRHLVGPTILDNTGGHLTNMFTFTNPGGSAGDNNSPNYPGDALYMVGYQQFVGFPNTPNPALYTKSIVTGSKLTLLIEPLEDQAGLENATIHGTATDANGNDYTTITDVPKYKSNNMMVAIIKCKRTSEALKSGDIFSIETQNPDCQLVTAKAFTNAKNRSIKVVSKFSTRGQFGTDLKDDEDIILEMSAGSAELKNDGITHMYQNSPDKDFIYRLVVYPEDNRYAVPDFKITAVEEMTMRAYDVLKQGQHDINKMRVDQAIAGATAAKRRRYDHSDELS